MALLFLMALPACARAQSAAEPAKEPIAVIDGKAVYEADLLASIRPQLRQLRNQEFDLKSKALDKLIEQKLLEAEAARQGVSAAKLLEVEVTSRAGEPSDAEVAAFYLGQKDRVNRPLDEVKADLRQALKQARVQQAREDLVRRLREKSEVVVLLRPARMEVSYDPSRVRGRPDAPVVIVEFSDFQCSYCQRVQQTLNEVVARYDGRVKLAFRDFPLRHLHPQAQAAAEAARCAAEQGKFWEYHDRLYSAGPSRLDAPALSGHARELGLDLKQFDSCVAGGKYRAQIEEDVQDGARAGISGTPAFFINGIFLSGAQPARVFEKTIELELAAAESRGRARKAGQRTGR